MLLTSGTSGPTPLVVRSFPDGRDLYRIVRPLEGGSGSEGEVTEAVDVSTGQRVALKRFLVDLASPGGDVAQLEERLDQLRRLTLTLQDVPGLVRYLPAFRAFAPCPPHLPPPPAAEATPAQAQWYLPMGLVSGVTLAVHIDAGLSPAQVRETLEALTATAEALETLAHAPDGPLVHKDVRPANVMLRTVTRGEGERLQAVLVDLGLMTRPDKTSVSSAGALGYMAPEILDGKPVPARRAHLADWYSFYATVAAVVAGHPPPSSPQRWAGDLRRAQVPASVVAVLVAAATAEPQDRPAPTVFLASVLTALSPEPHHRPLLLAGAALAGLVAFGVTVGVYVMRPSATSAQTTRTGQGPQTSLTGDSGPGIAPTGSASPTAPGPASASNPPMPALTAATRAAPSSGGPGGGSTGSTAVATRTLVITRTVTAAPTAGPRTVTRTTAAPRATSSPKPVATTQPQQQGVAETTGGVTHTWSDYKSAGGTAGQTINGQQTVLISCRVQGFRVQDGNTWWYRIASSPWTNNFYASADAFYNNGATSGSLNGTPYYDPNVPLC